MTFLDSFDAQQLLHVSHRTLNRLVRRGVLHAHRFPHSRKVYFSLDEIEKVLSLSRAVVPKARDRP